MSDTKPTTGFDPVVVAKFFATMDEFRQEIRELRAEVKSINDRLADGAKNFALLDMRMRQQSDWQDRKADECRAHQEQTRELSAQARELAVTAANVRDLQITVAALRDEIRDFKSQAAGITRLWKFLIAIATGMSTIIGVVTALKVLS